MPTTLELGLVGANRQGREHLVEARGVKIVAVCDEAAGVRETVAREDPRLRVYGTVEEMVDAGALDGLVVAVPHHVVPEIWSRLLSARLPLLKEKPLGRSLAEAHAFLAMAREAGVPVVTAIQRRKHPSYERLAELLASERVVAVAATLHLGFDPSELGSSWRAERPKAGGGALLDSGYHMVDLVQRLIGPLEFVHANLWTPRGLAGPDEIETEAAVVARAGNVWVRIESRVGGLPDPQRAGKHRKFERVEVETSRAHFAADRQTVWKDGKEIFTCPPQWRDAMVAQLEHFADMIRRAQFDEPIVWDQVAAMRLIEQAYDELGRYAHRLEGKSP